MSAKIMEEISRRKVFCDGGMGSLLQAKGLKAGELPETWNVLRPEILREIHKAYLEAGCDIVTTNTFGANRLKYPAGGPFDLKEIIEAAEDNARWAVSQAGRGFVALDLGPTGKLLKPLGDLDFDDACHIYREVVEAGRDRADLILVETMSDGYEAKAAILAAKENSTLPVFATMIFDGKGKLLTGGDVESVVALLEGLGVDALGINCGLGPVQMKAILEQILACASVPVIVNPNAGLPRSEKGVTVYDIDEDEFACVMEEIGRMGANVLGGCCGTTPGHIRKLTERCRDLKQVLPGEKNRTVVTSYTHGVVIGKDPVIIGERINPTGKSRFKQALRDHNLEYILQEGVSQQDHGAHVLDVNVGLPEIDEPRMMEEVVKELQSIIDLPLQIDTSDIQAMERAMRIYNGKPLINSVNGKKESMEAVFPLVKHYGGVVVALALDEGGIPDTAQGRIEVARKIYRTAASYGIHPKDILIDGLCLTVSSDSKGALTTLETLQRVRDELGGKTILGVSNISFGLPQREIINGAFFTMALANGLNAAIINPNSQVMMKAYYSFRALADLDSQCGDYIQVYGGAVQDGGGGTGGAGGTFGGVQKATAVSAQGGRTEADLSWAGTSPTPTRGNREAASGCGISGGVPGGNFMGLGDCVRRGLKDKARMAVTALLEQREALDIINEEMIPALDVVGKGFEQGTVFLPQLLMSAEAAREAFDVIKERMSEKGQAQEKKGTIILATVKGDIHDIGKNIVKVLLENYSYEVMDLGKDVAPERIVEETVKGRVPLVGLSALMTTTVPSMEETIKQLRKEAPWAKVMVGGAVLTEEYARTIGADQYCKDAMASVNYAESVIGGEA